MRRAPKDEPNSPARIATPRLRRILALIRVRSRVLSAVVEGTPRELSKAHLQAPMPQSLACHVRWPISTRALCLPRWQYILGNLVGLGNPLTDVGPGSGHVFAEIVDLLIAIWSLSVAGLVIGLLGSLAWVNVVTESADERMSQTFDQMIGFEDRVRDAVEGKASSMDFTAFKNLCKEEGLHISEAALRGMFNSADADGSGFIDKSEVESLLAKVRTAEHGGGSSTTGDIHARMDEMDSKFQSRMDAMDAKLDELLSRSEKKLLPVQ